jgi:2-polyprenyl-6-methoxyphenol hydroxylase-like FAD-dependent oxidoreductase
MEKERHDAVIVGARCAGSTLAIALAERGWDVALVDRDTFPSTTVSTHLIYPNTIANLERLGVLGTLQSEHELAFLKHRFVGLGNVVEGTYTSVGSWELMSAPRRIALDKAGVDTALAKGATAIFGNRVVDVIGAGTEEDPAHGVVLDDGRELHADWVFGADGRGSTVAGKLGIEKERQQRGELAFSYSYWSGVPYDPEDAYGTLQVNMDEMLYHGPVEDGLYFLIANGPPELAQGTHPERERKYMEAIRRFPETFDPSLLDGAEMVEEVTVAPEPLMQGFYRKPSGPGWALVGDACHFKHPGTAQGIGDAVEQSLYVAEALSTSNGGLDEYVEWRDKRSAEHYDWSFAWGHFPREETAIPLFRGWASEPDAGQDLRDTLSRLKEPSELMSKERLARWFSTAESEKEGISG